MGISPGERDPGELVDSQGLPSSRSRHFHSHVLEVMKGSR